MADGLRQFDIVSGAGKFDQGPSLYAVLSRYLTFKRLLSVYALSRCLKPIRRGSLKK
ncbi:hypothetical protein B0T26DRAFT_702890 [Lasiosphaeria miniovina]|uniref:Uncharacterized protein n=1 Tax=Lasiosphaeria miniovina TaxID=1954250 RepID=A0AA40E4S1_9PEZI|nr:uncharacterized protein B0T26DRAFT_702890 [Lasiosphaeria miniovina]KAK0722493.1 hypothetical protein B0T26DRAFT_702890 [Lasiosphaeria miniovina]